MILTAAALDRAISRYAEATAERGTLEVLRTGHVDVHGRADATPTTSAPRRVARVERLDVETIQEALAASAPTVERIYCDHGVLEPSPEGLVIVELAPGVSAVELQERVTPTLKITHLVQEMVLG